MTSGPDPGELPGFWGSMVFRHAPIPRKGSGKQQQQPMPRNVEGEKIFVRFSSHAVCVLLFSFNSSQTAMSLINNKKFHPGVIKYMYFHKPRMKRNDLIFRKFCPKCEKVAKVCYLAGCCGERNSGFEPLLKLLHRIVDDNCENIFSLLKGYN